MWLLLLLVAFVAVAIGLTIWYFYRRSTLQERIVEAVYQQAKQDNLIACDTDEDLKNMVTCSVQKWVDRYGVEKVYDIISKPISSDEEEKLFLLGAPCAPLCHPTTTSSTSSTSS